MCCLFTLLSFPRDKIIIQSFRSSLVHGSPSVPFVAAASMCRQGSQSGHGSGSTQKSPPVQALLKRRPWVARKDLEWHHGGPRDSKLPHLRGAQLLLAPGAATPDPPLHQPYSRDQKYVHACLGQAERSLQTRDFARRVSGVAGMGAAEDGFSLPSPEVPSQPTANPNLINQCQG